MASLFATGILQGVGKGLEIGYKRKEVDRKRKWEEDKIKKNLAASRDQYVFQKDYDASLKRVASVEMPFEQYITGQAQLASKAAGLSGRDAVLYQNAWAKANVNETNRKSYLTKSTQAKEELNRLRLGEPAPNADLKNLEQLTTTTPSFVPAGPADTSKPFNIFNPKTNILRLGSVRFGPRSGKDTILLLCAKCNSWRLGRSDGKATIILLLPKSNF